MSNIIDITNFEFPFGRWQHVNLHIILAMIKYNACFWLITQILHKTLITSRKHERQVNIMQEAKNKNLELISLKFQKSLCFLLVINVLCKIFVISQKYALYLIIANMMCKLTCCHLPNGNSKSVMSLLLDISFFNYVAFCFLFCVVVGVFYSFFFLFAKLHDQQLSITF